MVTRRQFIPRIVAGSEAPFAVPPRQLEAAEFVQSSGEPVTMRFQREPDPAQWPDPWHDRQAGKRRRRRLAHQAFVALAAAAIATAFLSGVILWARAIVELPGTVSARAEPVEAPFAP